MIYSCHLYFSVSKDILCKRATFCYLLIISNRMKGKTIRWLCICLSKHKAAGRKGNQGAAEQPPAGASEPCPGSRNGKKNQP